MKHISVFSFYLFIEKPTSTPHTILELLVYYVVSIEQVYYINSQIVTDSKIGLKIIENNVYGISHSISYV